MTNLSYGGLQYNSVNFQSAEYLLGLFFLVVINHMTDVPYHQRFLTSRFDKRCNNSLNLLSALSALLITI